MIEEYLFTTKYACTLLIVKDDKIIDAAPIYRKMVGWYITHLPKKGKLEKLKCSEKNL